jgi:predicted phage terminase large subunit-like protein
MNCAGPMLHAMGVCGCPSLAAPRASSADPVADLLAGLGLAASPDSAHRGGDDLGVIAAGSGANVATAVAPDPIHGLASLLAGVVGDGLVTVERVQSEVRGAGQVAELERAVAEHELARDDAALALAKHRERRAAAIVDGNGGGAVAVPVEPAAVDDHRGVRDLMDGLGHEQTIAIRDHAVNTNEKEKKPRRPRCVKCKPNYDCSRHVGNNQALKPPRVPAPAREPVISGPVAAPAPDPAFAAMVSGLLGKNSAHAQPEPAPAPEAAATAPKLAPARRMAIAATLAAAVGLSHPTGAVANEATLDNANVTSVSRLTRAISTDERAEKARKSRIELARRKLSWFVRLAFSEVLRQGEKLEWAWYLDAICDTVQAQIEGWFVANGITPRDENGDETLPGLIERENARWAAHRTCPRDDKGRLLDGHADCTTCPRLTRQPGQLLAQSIAYNISPGTLKSVIIMVCAPAWAWLHAPSFKWGATSGNPENVTRDSDAHRDLVNSPWYRESFAIKWEVRPDIDAKGLWQTTAGGSRLSRGLVAKWTGVHVDGLLCDDPDDAHAVFGEPARREVQGKFTNAIENRVNSLERSIRLVVQQHVHTDDLTSYLLSKGVWTPLRRSSWAKLEIAMEFNPSRRSWTPYGWTDPRKESGEVMHEIRFPRRILDAERLRLGTYGYEAQYNQAPEILDGGMFKRSWFRFFLPADAENDPRPRPPECRTRTDDPAYIIPRDKRGALTLDFLAISVDATFGSTNADASNVGLLAIGGSGNRRFIFDDRTKARNFPDTKRAIVEMIIAWKPSRVLIERKANGQACIDELTTAIAEAQIRDDKGDPIVCVLEPIEPKDDGGSKAARAAAAMPSVEAGLVYVLDGAAWADDFIGEVCAFPNGRKDDRVDALTQAINFYRGALSALARWEAMAAM